MADVHTNLEAQVRHALDVGELSIELEHRLIGIEDCGLSDRDRKLLLLLQDAIGSGHVRRLVERQSSRMG
ncbi:MAG: hypothetical protein WBA10_15365 [Elainellaceae cyanobacterium]